MTLHSQLYENRFCDREDFESKLGKNLKNTQGRGITHFLTRSSCMQEYFDQVKHKQVLYSFFFLRIYSQEKFTAFNFSLLPLHKLKAN